MREIHQWPVNFPHKGPVTRKKFAFDDVIMESNVSQPCMNISWTACRCTVQHALPVSHHSISHCIILAQISCKFNIRRWLTQPLDTESRPNISEARVLSSRSLSSRDLHQIHVGPSLTVILWYLILRQCTWLTFEIPNQYPKNRILLSASKQLAVCHYVFFWP